MSDRPIFIRDTRGYSCSNCRQRFPNSINLADFHCPACYRVSISSPSRKMGRSSFSSGIRDNQIGSRVSQVVDKIKVKFSDLKRRRRDSSDSDTPKTLNSNPSPLAAKPPSSAVTRPGRKRALLIGVTYAKWKYKLKGTVNDVKNMRNLLIENFHFQKENVLVLTEEESKAELTPTKKNIEAALKWLVEDCRKGDSLVFYFSGHGLRQPDFNNDERDGFDETICPVDFVEQGMILDNDINSTIVWPLPKGVTLHAIVDACHSGTILDLVYIYNRHKKTWEDNSPPNKTRKHTNGGLAISIAACEDHQMAADTTAFSGKGMNGALTYILIEIVKQSPSQGPTYADLIEMIHQTIDVVNKSGCLPVRIIRSICHTNLLQKPLLSASEPFDVKNTRFIL
ncbi:metacaspase-1-like [Euphorbia lathyris]|uniref:metacaspase-1-like n=1 Tax=Euphorbia lathyris TaxID=212925 RepID=UPI003313E382